MNVSEKLVDLDLKCRYIAIDVVGQYILIIPFNRNFINIGKTE